MTDADEGPGLMELQLLSSWKVVQLNALYQNFRSSEFNRLRKKKSSTFQSIYLLRNGKCFCFELIGLGGLAEKAAKSPYVSELVSSSGPCLFKSKGGGMCFTFLLGRLAQWSVITVGIDGSTSQHLDLLLTSPFLADIIGHRYIEASN